MLKKENFIKARKQLLIALVCLALILPAAIFIAKSWIGASIQEREEQAVLNAAREFLDAEVRRDYPAVYACFASSSPYARLHDYERYLAQAKASADNVSDYRIVAVSYIQKNEDQKKYPLVEKIAQVEVEVTFQNNRTKSYSDVNIGFIFLKEQGRWYKS
jgi:type II secretory pathway pseudopilin PulG